MTNRNLYNYTKQRYSISHLLPANTDYLMDIEMLSLEQAKRVQLHRDKEWVHFKYLVMVLQDDD